MKKGIFIVFLVCFQSSFAQVGIGTTDPQQTLHVASPTGTIRVESLNGANNSFNGGDADGDSDPTNDTYPLYVDENGDFTLELKVLDIPDGTDDIIDDPTTTSAHLTSGDSDGIAGTDIKTYIITTSRPAMLQVNYALSYDIYLNPSKVTITDNFARSIQTQINVKKDGIEDPRRYGRSAKPYTSGEPDSVNGRFYNSGSTYITLPSAGTYEIIFKGYVLSGTKSGGGGSTSKEAYVEFATGKDLIFMRLY